MANRKKIYIYHWNNTSFVQDKSEFSWQKYLFVNIVGPSKAILLCDWYLDVNLNHLVFQKYFEFISLVIMRVQ